MPGSSAQYEAMGDGSPGLRQEISTNVICMLANIIIYLHPFITKSADSNVYHTPGQSKSQWGDISYCGSPADFFLIRNLQSTAGNLFDRCLAHE